MALVLVATPKAANANAYHRPAAADNYFLGRLNAAKWNATPPTAQKELALVAATNRLEQEEYWECRPRSAATEVATVRD
jgi:hypothetical protein